MDWVVGFQNVPVTINTSVTMHPSRGPLTTSVGLDYLMGEGEVLILDVWINPAFKEQISAIELMCITHFATGELVRALDAKQQTEREWKGVVYG